MIVNKTSAHLFIISAIMLSTPSSALAEDNALINNIIRAIEPDMKQRAEKQGKLVSSLLKRHLSDLISVIPGKPIHRNTDTELNVSATIPEVMVEYVATWAGNAWAQHAYKQIEERQREITTQALPEIKATMEANAAARREEQRLRQEIAAEKERRAKTYGPAKPNAFY